MMRSLLLFPALLLFFPVLSYAQDRTLTIRVADPLAGKGIAHARITVSDTGGPVLHIGYSDPDGFLTIKRPEHDYTILIDSIPLRCDGTNKSSKFYMEINENSDTVRIVLSHLFIDYTVQNIYFELAQNKFSYRRDSVATCSFIEPDSSCIKLLTSHGLFIYYNLCSPFPKVEVRSYYTDAEDSLCGDSLAKVRATLITRLFVKHGMTDVEFVIVPTRYFTRPLKEADGRINYEQTALLSFRIIEW